MTQNTSFPPEKLANKAPIDLLHPDNTAWAKNLQGNILNGHGRDHTVHIFFRLSGSSLEVDRTVISQLAALVTSAYKQEIERKQFKEFGIPGRLFGNLFISARGYRALGHDADQIREAFTEDAESIRDVQSNFLDGMAKHAATDLGDIPPNDWDPGFQAGDIDAMLLIADDDEGVVGRAARGVIDLLDNAGATIAHVERGTALRNDDGEGIEHFGYIDGRSQPLFLASDFEPLKLTASGEIDTAVTREKGGGAIDIWNPFEPLQLVLKSDPLANADNCLGSYFVFRKLEQNVRDFTIAEQLLADKLGLKDGERERAGAMTVGRFRDGTPLVLSQTDGFVPAKENNFRHNAAASGTPDKQALKCPFQGHIRKTNPRGDIIEQLGGTEKDERSRRIARRGIPYGKRIRHPNAFQALDDLPSKGVGLLFMCFQSSIRKQFAFMQRSWANNQDFATGAVGIDPIIGQIDHEGGEPVSQIDQPWLAEWNGEGPRTPSFFGHFTQMRGGEFFFAPSIPYLSGLAPAASLSPLIAAMTPAALPAK